MHRGDRVHERCCPSGAFGFWVARSCWPPLAVGVIGVIDRGAASCGASTGRRSCSSSMATFGVVLLIKDIGAVRSGDPRTSSAPSAAGLRPGRWTILRATEDPGIRSRADCPGISPSSCWPACGCCSTAPAGAPWCGPRPKTARWSGRARGQPGAGCSPACCSCSARSLAGPGRRAAAAQARRRSVTTWISPSSPTVFVVVVVGGMGSIVGRVPGRHR